MLFHSNHWEITFPVLQVADDASANASWGCMRLPVSSSSMIVFTRCAVGVPLQAASVQLCHFGSSPRRFVLSLFAMATSGRGICSRMSYRAKEERDPND